MASPYRYLRLNRRLACENRCYEIFFDTVEAPGGEVVKDFLIVRPKLSASGGFVGVCVLPEVGGKIGLMHGWRHQLDEEVWQAPGGFIDPGETIQQAALRELSEETALICAPESLKSLGTYIPDAGLIEGRIALFFAGDCALGSQGRAPQPEIGTGTLRFFDKDELTSLTNRSASICGSTLAACFRYLCASR